LLKRLDENFPERNSDSGYKSESHYLDFSDGISHSTGSSRPQTPSSRRGSLMEEMRRQSAVFFDDTDLYGDEYAVVT
jgi:hypothetical protein